ncbi:unnamed protein product [Sphagnum troendelagicum]
MKTGVEMWGPISNPAKGWLETGPLIHSDSRERKEGSESGEREWALIAARSNRRRLEEEASSCNQQQLLLGLPVPNLELFFPSCTMSNNNNNSSCSSSSSLKPQHCSSSSASSRSRELLVF